MVIPVRSMLGRNHGGQIKIVIGDRGQGSTGRRLQIPIGVQQVPVEQQFDADVTTGSGRPSAQSGVLQCGGYRAVVMTEPGVAMEGVVGSVMEGNPGRHVPMVGRVEQPEPAHGGKVGQRGTDQYPNPLGWDLVEGDSDVADEVHAVMAL